MTAATPWGDKSVPDPEGVDRLSRMVAGNDRLVEEPGLVQALFQGGATPQQSQALNQFLLGLDAEKAVRTAGASGQRITLSQDQQDALDAMGIDYQPVLYTPQDALAQLTSDMAAKGVQPVIDPVTGQPKTDAQGNVISQKIPQKKSGGGGFFGSIGGFFSHVGSAIKSGAGEALHGLNEGWNYVDYYASHLATDTVHDAESEFRDLSHGDFAAAGKDVVSAIPFVDITKQMLAKPSDSETQAMLAQGYDPTSFFSYQAYKASGKAPRDLAPLNKQYGEDQVNDALRYLNDPNGYRQSIENNPNYYVVGADGKQTPTAEGAAALKHLVSPEFGDLVKRVAADQATVGNVVASGLGIDPVKHASTFAITSAATETVASILMDPTAVALSGYSSAVRAGAAMKNLADAEEVTRVFKPADGVRVALGQRRSINYLQSMVKQTNDLRAATDAGDTAKAAKIQAGLHASNPFAGLVGDFLGKDQIVGLKSESELQNLKRGELPFVTGEGPAIDTFDKAVDYLASKSALLRLTSGYAPVEASVMPGALSSYGFSRIRGAVASLTAGRSAAKSARAVEKVLADPGKLKAIVHKTTLTRVIPSEDDAVDVLSGNVIAAGKANADTVAGVLRGNKIRYGTFREPTTALGKVLSIYTLGSVERAKLALTRLSSFLPRDTHVDVTSSASADTVYRIARTYLTRGDAASFAARWHVGDAETRKTIVQGLKTQIAHAAGLTRTKAGKELVDSWAANPEKYAAFGTEFTDVNGVPGAQWAGQVQTRFSLPNFGAVHQAAAKVGLFEGTMGRLLGSAPMQKLLMQWKLGALFTPVTAMRANIESWLNASAEGMFKDAASAKAVLRDAGKLEGEDIARSRPVDKVLSLAPLQGAGRIYRHVAQSGMDENVGRAIAEMPDDILHSYVHDQAAYHYAMSVDPAGTGEATEIARNGYRAVRASYDSKQGFDAGIRNRKGYEVTHEVEGVAGANLYAHNLALRVNKAPNVAKAIIDRMADPDLGFDGVVKALDETPLMRQTLYGKVFLHDDGTQAKAVTDAEIQLGKEQWADQITAEFKKMITGQNGVRQQKILDYIVKHGEAPAADWILKNVTNLNRPQALLKPIFDAVPTEGTGVKGIIDNIMEAEGKGYQWLVERLIQRHSTAPLFAAAYGKSKVGLEGFKQKLIENGISDVAAERATANIAAEQAWSRIARMLDDPHMKSQMDIVGRGFFAFSRATTMMLRRWGSTFWRNPAQARRFMLAAEGAVHSGLVYKDPSTGQWMFHFPASGVAQEVLFHAVSHIPGLEGLAQFPTSDFTGRAASIIPGSDNPFQYQTTPMVSLSGRAIASLFPAHREWFDEVDRKLNGSMGQGQGFWATLEPSLVKKLTDPASDDRNSMTASAMVGSLYNLYAAGLVPPDGASPSQVEEFLGRLQTQTKSQIYLRAFLGAFSPASIALPENENAASKPDYAFVTAGAQGLRDEYKVILNDVGGDLARATAIWTTLHPDLTVYEQSGSQASTSHAVMPATQSALNWMNSNLGFIGKYKSVSAYFIPEQSKGDPYSQAAYRAQLEEGLRQKKTPQEFLNGVRYSTAATTYYAMEDKYLADLAAAKNAGNDQLAAQHRADWLAWSKQFKAAHPVFAQKVESSVANVVNAQGQIADLRAMVKNGDVPNGLGPAVAGMIQAYDGYRQFVNDHPGETNQAQASRAAAATMLQDYLSSVVAAVPEVGDLYAGVFRALDTKLDPISGG